MLTLALPKDAVACMTTALECPEKRWEMSTVAVQPSSVRVTTPVVKPSVFLTPERVAKMLAERRSFQIVKFRTNCSDCVPNL
jgi:hypothetical protein